MQSIHSRLLFPIMFAFCLAWVVGGWLSWDYISHEIEEVFDAEMVQTSKLLTSMLNHEINEQDVLTISLDSSVLHHEYEANIAFQVWQNDRLLAKSPFIVDQKIIAPEGFSHQLVNGKDWRVFNVHHAGQQSNIIIAELMEVREELISYIAGSMVGPFLIAIPLLLASLWIIIGSALKPLQRVAAQVESRTATDLTQLGTTDVPREINVLVRSINQLLQRLKRAFDSEQRFTSDAAHELRTPLAGLKTQAQVALRAQNIEQRDKALAQINLAADRATRLVEQLLTLARVDPESASQSTTSINLCQLVIDVVAELAPEAHNRNIDLGIDHCFPAQILGIETALLILVSNIVENAIRYVASGGVISVSVASKNNKAVLTILDNGPGIPEVLYDRVFERFYRSPEHNASKGCGLGLSIVKRIADIHQAEIQLDKPAQGNGLVFRVLFDIQEPKA